MIRISIDYLNYLLALCACTLLNLIPYRISIILAKLLGWCAYYVMRTRRNITLDNLRRAFGDEMSDAQIRTIARRSFSELTLLFIEFIRIPKMLKNFSKYVTIDRPEVIWNALEKGKGLIMISGHFGNWEMMGILSGLAGFPVYTIGRPMKNRFIYDYITSIRTSTGVQNISNKGVAKELIRHLRANHALAILFDQYAGSRGEPVPFFGRPAYTTTAVAQLSLHTGAPVLPLFVVREKDGTFTVHTMEPLEPVNTGNKKADYIENTRIYNEILETWIRTYPEQWFWFHRRWKKPRRLMQQESESSR